MANIEQQITQLDKGSGVAYSIAHAVPGRVRFRVPRLIHDPAYAQRLQESIGSEAQVTSVRVNRAAASIVITYKTGVFAAKEVHFCAQRGHVDTHRESYREDNVTGGVLHLVDLIQSASNAVIPRKSKPADQETSPNSQTVEPILESPAKPSVLACSLEVRKAKTSSDCGLLKNKAGEPLKGGALKARLRKLHRLGIWIESSDVV